MTDRKKIAEIVRRHRQALGLTQTQLAEQARMGQSSISRIEVGEVDLSVSDLQTLAKILKIDPEEMLDDQGAAATPDRTGRALLRLLPEIDVEDRKLLLNIARLMADRK